MSKHNAERCCLNCVHSEKVEGWKRHCTLKNQGKWENEKCNEHDYIEFEKICTKCNEPFMAKGRQSICRPCYRKNMMRRMQSEAEGAIMGFGLPQEELTEEKIKKLIGFGRVTIEVNETKEMIYNCEKLFPFKYHEKRELLTRRRLFQMTKYEIEELLRMHGDGEIKKPLVDSEIKLLEEEK